jgi:hypothetical protein
LIRCPQNRGKVIGWRIAFADTASSSQFAWKRLKDGYAARAEDRARCRNLKRRTVAAYHRSICRIPEGSQVRSRNPEDRAVESATKAERLTARMAIDITPEPSGHIKVTAFPRGQIVVETMRNLHGNFVKCHGAWFDD